MNIFQSLTDLDFSVFWHENKSSYLSVKKVHNRFELRLHKLFQKAPSPVLEAIVSYAVKRDASSKKIIKQMAFLYFSQETKPSNIINSQGKYYDLQEMYDRLSVPFPSLPQITIGWATVKKKGTFRHMTFGSYDQHTRQIRIHPLLDDLKVPKFFVEFVVFHEILHAVIPTKINHDARCIMHSRQFRQLEKTFPEYEMAKQWEKNSLNFFKTRTFHGRT